MTDIINSKKEDTATMNLYPTLASAIKATTASGNQVYVNVTDYGDGDYGCAVCMEENSLDAVGWFDVNKEADLDPYGLSLEEFVRDRVSSKAYEV